VGDGVTANQLWLQRTGNDLRLNVIGSSDSMTIQGWYGGTAARIEQFGTADGKALVESRVETLVAAMAAFAPPAAGQTTLPSSYQTALNPIIAANWR
jgi:hypothetical protein